MKILYYFSKNFFAHESLHFLSGILLAIIFYCRYSSVRLSLVCFLVSVFIDADHYAEGLLVERFNFNRIFNRRGSYWRETGKVTILFHTWEILPVVLLLGKITGLWPLALGICISAAVHYFIDTFLYATFASMSVFQYFIVYRLYHHFSFEVLCRNHKEHSE